MVEDFVYFLGSIRIEVAPVDAEPLQQLKSSLYDELITGIAGYWSQADTAADQRAENAFES
jgi:hypothetical protein